MKLDEKIEAMLEDLVNKCEGDIRKAQTIVLERAAKTYRNDCEWPFDFEVEDVEDLFYQYQEKRGLIPFEEMEEYEFEREQLKEEVVNALCKSRDKDDYFYFIDQVLVLVPEKHVELAIDELAEEMNSDGYPNRFVFEDMGKDWLKKTLLRDLRDK